MKLLKIRIKGVPLFEKDTLELDFFAQNRVPLNDDCKLPNDVFKLNSKDAIYSQNIIGLAGVNAAGKTTVLNLIQLILAYFVEPATVRKFANSPVSRIGKISDTLYVSAIFWEKNAYYLLESELKHSVKSAENENKSSLDSFIFTDETLRKYTAPRINRSSLKSFEEFRDKTTIIKRRNGPKDDETVLNETERTFLSDGISIVTAIVRPGKTIVESRNKELPEESLSTPIVQAFDNSIEYLSWDTDAHVYHLKFKNEKELVVDRNVANAILSRGTIAGSELVSHASDVLRSGGYFVVDEIEEALNRSLVSTVLELFASPITNPHGATLIFSTHYPQLLDSIHRKDNVYVLVRNDECKTKAVKFSDEIKRIENKKSEVILTNLIKGSTPRYPDVQRMREFVKDYVNEH